MTKKMKAFKEKCNENRSKMLDLAQYKYDERLELCREFFNKLAEMLADRYEVMGSCNKDCSLYLIPIGTQDQVTYYGKPDLSFRISDHWNWYTNLSKCSDPHYIQCESVNLPKPRRRQAEGMSSLPIKASQVAVRLQDGKYHHIFGELWDKSAKRWRFIESDPSEVLRGLGLV